MVTTEGARSGTRGKGWAMLAEEGAAIEVVFADNFPRLERQLTSIMRDPEDGRELAAEAFARFSREIAAGNPPSNPEAWLRRVGSNLAWSRGRHMTVVRRRLAQMGTPPASVPPEALVIMAETWRELAGIIDDLAPSERQAIMLAARGYGSAEIGAALGRTSGAARTLLCRTRAKLRNHLEAAGVLIGSWIVYLAGDESPISVLLS